MGRLVEIVFKWFSRHIHDWKFEDWDIVAEGQKGEREKYYVQGCFQRCAKCQDGRFIPISKNLRIVECEKVTNEL